MASADYDACETRVLAHEGGYTNDPQDPGGPTNWGITIFDARKYWKPNATAADVKAMPIGVAKSIYRAKYWNALACDDLPAGVDDSVFDYGVNSGIGRSGKVLRRLVAQPDNDWRVTPDVLAAVKQRSANELIDAINDERMRFLRSLSTFPHFGNGWTARVKEVRGFSHQLAGGVKPLPPKTPIPGKGQVPKPNPGPIVVGGGGAAAASGGFVHWLGAHPAVTAVLVAAAIAVVVFVFSRIKASRQAQQEAPTPGTTPVPARPGASS